MGNILTESFDIVRPDLPGVLVAPEVVPRLRKAAHLLAPIPAFRVGLECRLSADSSQVDLQQGLINRDGEPAILAEHLASLFAAADRPLPLAWNRLCDFGAAWSDPNSPLHTAITEFWLEFDIAGEREAPISASISLIPSVFVGLDQKLLPTREANTCAETALEILLGSQFSPVLRQNLGRCFNVCPEGVLISHVGAMLSRETEALRMNIKGLSLDQTPAFLKQVGWPAPADELIIFMEPYLDLVDEIRLCLDIGTGIYPRAGLECFIQGQPDHNPRWAAFLDRLVADGLCASDKREALLAWPGQLDPASSTALWPAGLIIESLLQPSDHFNFLSRQFNHVKVTYQPQHPLEAKAYLGFVRAWWSPKSTPPKTSNSDALDCDAIGVQEKRVEVHKVQPGAASRAVGNVDLETALQLAIVFLLGARNQKGCWRDFHDCAGGSDEWVTAFVGVALAGGSDKRARQAANQAWSLLVQRQRPSGGWGYNILLPPDADSTAWSLRLAHAVGAGNSPPVQIARLFLNAHLLPDSGVASYREEVCAGLAPYLSAAPANGSYAGWSVAHTCVTAAVAAIEDLGQHPRNFLRSTQRPDGSWKGYWWDGDEYTTALAAEALAETRQVDDQAQAQTAVEWAIQKIQPSGAVYSVGQGDDSAFATAWCIRILALADNFQRVREPLQQAVNWLLEQQKPGGVWISSARLRTPPAHVVHPEEHAAPLPVFLDRAGIFTTATVLSALEAARSHLEHINRTY
jgi:hypothetical protein